MAELAASIERDPGRVAGAARALAVEFRDRREHASLSRVLAVAGRAQRLMGEIDLAEQLLGEAIAAAGAAGDDELAADAHLALAGVLALGGSGDEAIAHLDEVERIGSDGLRARAELQRAVLYRRFGRVPEALELFTRAVPRLRSTGADLDLARVLANRGGIHLSDGRVVDAITDFTEAEQLFEAAGHEFVAAQVHHDLACAIASRGDLPTALRMFDEAVGEFTRLGHDASVPLLSRGEALLTAGLSTDAFEFSRNAAERLESEGNRAAAAEALLAMAEAARLEGDLTVARAAAARAESWFAATGSAGWQRAAQLLMHRVDIESDCADATAAEQLESIVANTASCGDIRTGVTAGCLAAVARSRRGDLALAAADLQTVATIASGRELIDVRLAIAHAQVVVDIASGELQRARRRLRRAFDLVGEQHHAASPAGASAAGASTTVRLVDLAAAAREMAIAEQRPIAALEWMERSRLADRATPPALPPASLALAELFDELRVAAAELRRAELDGAPTGELRRRLADIERRIRDHTLAEPRRRPVNGASIHGGELPERLGDAQLVSVMLHDGSAAAVVVGRRQSRWIELGPVDRITAAVQRGRTALAGLARTDPRSELIDDRRRRWRQAAHALDATLVAPLNLDSERIIVVAPPELHAVPWAGLPSLHHRSITLAPSAAWWVDAVARPTTPPGRIAVVAGPRLAEAETEAKEIAACYPDAELLMGADASVAGVRRGLDRAPIAHIAAHGTFRHDNPLWSTIELADGMLSVYELERSSRVPDTIVIAACDSGLAGARGGTQLHGLASTLLSMGARSIVASVNSLPDAADTRETMVDLHRRLAAGATPGDALATQRRDRSALDALDGHGATTDACLVTIGVG